MREEAYEGEKRCKEEGKYEVQEGEKRCKEEGEMSGRLSGRRYEHRQVRRDVR